MRHNKSFNHLGRTSSHRKAMLSNMASSLIMHKSITTTVAKAKALRPYVEKLITKAKEDNMHNRRIVFSYLQSKFSTKEIFGAVAEKVATRPGGYTRILKTGNRLGDNAEMCMMELVDFNEYYQKADTTKKTAAKRTRRAGSTAKPKDTAPAAEPTKTEEAESNEVADTTEE
ncbi:MAG: 50S ribosomal protein L17 [Bacteroidota bacterium]|nr:50S ribosomal protein L17 [Bacteroidota bacterium]